MILFLSLFLLLYGSLNTYFFFKLRAAFPLGFWFNFASALFLFLMIAAPVLTHVFERQSWEGAAKVLAYIGYIWMGALFLFFSASLLFEAWRLLIFLLGLAARQNWPSLRLSARLLFLLPTTIAALTAFYGYFEAKAIRLERVIIHSEKISARSGGIKLAQISDLHLGLIVGPERLAKIIALLQTEKPDIIVCTGDLVDGDVCRDETIVRQLRSLSPPLGKFAVTGNHEFYAGLDKALAFTQEAGFKILRGEAVVVADDLRLVGVDDPEAKSFGRLTGQSEAELLNQAGGWFGNPVAQKPGLFTILLKHRPMVNSSSLGGFDLQLSGHAHMGQIFPFTLLVQRFFPKIAGLYPLDRGSKLYVSRGTGTWGPPIRFFAPPEVTMIEIASAPP